MKKVMLIALVMAIFTVVNLAAQEDWWYVTNREGASRPRENWNQTTLRANNQNFIYVYFRGDMNPVGAQFDKIRVNFTLSQSLEVMWQCAYYASMSGGVLGYVDPATKKDGFTTGVRNSGPIETDFSFLNANWSGGATVLDKTKMTGFCLQIPIPRGGEAATITINSIEFIGLQR